MKSIRNNFSCLLTFVIFIASSSLLLAQDSIVIVTAQAQGLNLVSPSDLPSDGTFWMAEASGILSPYPCPPPNVASLPVFQITENQFLIDASNGEVTTGPDQSVEDAVAAMANDVQNLISQIQGVTPSQSLSRGGAHAMVDIDPNDADTNSDGYTNIDFPSDPESEAKFTTNQLWLQIIAKTNTTLYLVIHPPWNVTNGVYDLFATTNLNSNGSGLNITNWVWLMRCAAGQTNLTVTDFSTTGQCYFRLGTTNDTDNDGLTDAYEKLVSHTDPNNPDTDGDGLSDLFELQNGLNPNNAYSQDSTHNQKDGAWLLTAITGQSHTRASITLDTVDTYYDSTYGVTVLYFAVSGITSNDQYDIYIQTPSTDTTDTNKVWQDMFADFGYDRFGPYSGGIYIYATEWLGNVPTNGTVKFALADSQDRDFDGLPDGYEILSAHTIVGVPSSDNSGIVDGDADIGQDGLSNVQKLQRGLNPLVAVSTNSLAGNGMPDWFTNYIAFWYGTSQTGPWADPDGDQVPNIVEYDLGTDPVVGDYWADLPPPPGDESQQFVSIQFNASYGASEGPNNNPYFPGSSISAGPLGAVCSMTTQTSGSGAGTASLDFEIAPLDQAYDYYAPFTTTADPSQFEFQEPDPADGTLYRQLLLDAPDEADHLWHAIEEPTLELLHSDTLEYVHAVSMMKIQLEARQIQYLQYLQTSGGNQPGTIIRIQRCENIIQAEATKITAIDIQYVRKYPNLDWIGRSLTAGGFFACGISWYYDWSELTDDIEGYKNDVHNHANTAGADLLSSRIQSMLQDMPGLPTWFSVGLDPSVPIFSPDPLGWYDGY